MLDKSQALRNFFQERLQEHEQVFSNLHALFPLLQTVSSRILEKIQAGGTVYWMGNGGSAADAQHMAAELVGRFLCERPPIASVALTTDSSVLTALSNDYDFSILFSRQLEALCKPQDVVIGLSTSGESLNILKGMAAAKARGALTVGLTGSNGHTLHAACDFCFMIPSTHTPRIQEAHTFIAHCLCEAIERGLS